MKVDRPEKHSNLLEEIRRHLKSGKYRYAGHATERLVERKITRPEVIQVLEAGYHEKAKDTFDEAYLAWNYSVRGKTVDDRRLRIIVSFEKANILIITVIDLDD